MFCGVCVHASPTERVSTTNLACCCGKPAQYGGSPVPAACSRTNHGCSDSHFVKNTLHCLFDRLPLTACLLLTQPTTPAGIGAIDGNTAECIDSSRFMSIAPTRRCWPCCLCEQLSYLTSYMRLLKLLRKRHLKAQFVA